MSASLPRKVSHAGEFTVWASSDRQRPRYKTCYEEEASRAPPPSTRQVWARRSARREDPPSSAVTQMRACSTAATKPVGIPKSPKSPLSYLTLSAQVKFWVPGVWSQAET
ncbi:hypothetical protein HPP92_006842 [Vanilla planifolia]|uniref:Uncharacterized protein n=1 Tax=Vanilla planifolia TaxID=51239 RepID=A0A835RF55_VANPL|nr:hypothetical protein HPP92_006842 [Vanilla planifolia]